MSKIDNNIPIEFQKDKDYNETLENINKINKIIHEELEEKIKNNRAIVNDDGTIEKYCENYSFVKPNIMVDYRDTKGEQLKKNKKFKPNIKDYIKLIDIVILNTDSIYLENNKENINNHLKNINNILLFLESKKKFTNKNEKSMTISDLDLSENNNEKNELTYNQIKEVPIEEEMKLEAKNTTFIGRKKKNK